LDLQSPFRYNDEAAKEFSSLTSSCGKSNYAYTTPAPIAKNGTNITTATATPTPCPDTYTIQAGDDCNKISIAHNVSTYSLLYENELQAYCRDFPKAGTNLCLPKQCDIYTLQANDTCYSVAQSQPSHVTITQIIAWNNNLNAECSNINQQVGSQICVRFAALTAQTSLGQS
jgi:LysM repeat protein